MSVSKHGEEKILNNIILWFLLCVSEQVTYSVRSPLLSFIVVCKLFSNIFLLSDLIFSTSPVLVHGIADWSPCYYNANI